MVYIIRDRHQEIVGICKIEESLTKSVIETALKAFNIEYKASMRYSHTDKGIDVYDRHSKTTLYTLTIIGKAKVKDLIVVYRRKVHGVRDQVLKLNQILIWLFKCQMPIKKGD